MRVKGKKERIVTFPWDLKLRVLKAYISDFRTSSLNLAMKPGVRQERGKMKEVGVRSQVGVSMIDQVNPR